MIKPTKKLSLCTILKGKYTVLYFHTKADAEYVTGMNHNFFSTNVQKFVCYFSFPLK